MTLPLSAAGVLGEHVVFELECIDRVYCNAYVPKLAYPGGVAAFFTKHRGATFASTCLADPISKTVRRCDPAVRGGARDPDRAV